MISIPTSTKLSIEACALGGIVGTVWHYLPTILAAVASGMAGLWYGVQLYYFLKEKRGH